MNSGTENLPPRKNRKEARQRLQKELHESRKSRLKDELMEHIGRQNAIGMAELYELIYGESWENRINDTRGIRKLITELRNEGRPVCSISNRNGGGYYLAAAGSELENYLQANERRALRVLARNSRIKKIALPEYLGQVRLSLEEAA
jgi:FMN phosphatase YigB (HAD superfamily)